MSETDKCARCGGDCPFIPDCKICGGCEEVACPNHNPEFDMDAMDDENDYYDVDYGEFEYGEPMDTSRYSR